MSTPPRRKQRAVTIRSDRALARLVLLTRDGRTYTYNYPQTLQDLHVVTGLR